VTLNDEPLITDAAGLFTKENVTVPYRLAFATPTATRSSSTTASPALIQNSSGVSRSSSSPP